ncbi:MAG TPA: aldehyde dehydrogenase family protein [Acidimicrobiia bacterium]|nr:aldehyde dehydrogenase family protein [Acidimicrobiia bacterium]
MDLQALVDGGSLYIDGRWEAGEGEPFDVVNPTTEEVLATVPSAGAGQVDAAVASARRAFDGGVWSAHGPAERAALLRRIVKAIEDNFDDLVDTVVREVGTPIMLARALQVAGPVLNLGWYASAAERGPRGGYEEGLPLDYVPVASASLLKREPIGVVAAIPAFNYPLNLASWKAGGALASGCSTVLYPSPRGTLSTIHFLRVLEEADLPPGALNLVVGGADVGTRLTTAPGVDMVSFTGSAKVGSMVMAQASATLKKVVLELGGKSPNILLPGADIDVSLAPSILRFARNAGQGCGATTRILVHRSQFDEFMAKATPFVESLEVGDPMSPDTVIGPLIDGGHREWVERMLADAVADGATIAAGGGRPDIERGWFLNPALVVGAPNEAPVCQEELFAPVGAVIPYDTVDEAVAVANASRYNLNANVYGEPGEAMAVANRLRTGTVQVNGGGGMRPDAPWGGSGFSGVGREMGEDGFAEFFVVRHIQWPLGAPAAPQGTARSGDD